MNTFANTGYRFRFTSALPWLLCLATLAPATPAHAAWKSHHPKPAAEQPGPVRVFPKAELADGHQLAYVGAFSYDGKYKALTKMDVFLDSMKNASIAGSPEKQLSPDEELKQQDEMRQQVPPNVELPKNERQVEDFQPPERAVKEAKPRSVFANLRDSFVSLSYGADQVLSWPDSVTTDSQNRVIVTDRGGVHVLAYNAKDSFQIVGGPGRRFESPGGVAVDGEDNLYISDSKRGVVLVYDSEGRYLRTLGDIEDEGTFGAPTSLAIDKQGKRLYVADPPRHAVFILDLNGKLLGRVGSPGVDSTGFNIRSGNPNADGFQKPEAILLHKDEIYVLDGKRIHVMTLSGKLMREFSIEIDPTLKPTPKIEVSADPDVKPKPDNKPNLAQGRTPGLFIDAQGHIFVSEPFNGLVREYNQDGHTLGAFGRPGLRQGEFTAPAGMWADGSGRIFIVDARRVQIFQLDKK